MQFFGFALARILITVRAPEGKDPRLRRTREIEQRLIRAARRWEDVAAGARRAVRRAWSGADAALRRGLPGGLPREDSPRACGGSTSSRWICARRRRARLNLYVPLEVRAGQLNLPLPSWRPVPCRRARRCSEKMGVKVMDERPSEIERQDGSAVWLHDFRPAVPPTQRTSTSTTSARSFRRPSSPRGAAAENDGLQPPGAARRTVVAQVAVLRAYARHMRQAAGSPSASPHGTDAGGLSATRPCAAATFRHPLRPGIRGRSRGCVRGPGSGDRGRLTRSPTSTRTASCASSSPSSRRTLRAPTGSSAAPTAAQSLPRSSSCRRRSQPAAAAPDVRDLRLSPRFEGIHPRRQGRARRAALVGPHGGDFRTEILGLVKAQIGQERGDRAGRLQRAASWSSARRRGGREAPSRRGRGLLPQLPARPAVDLTDNLVQGAVVPPADVVRHDGTTLPGGRRRQGARRVLRLRQRSLGRARLLAGRRLRLGGSVGYDHKKMGITAAAPGSSATSARWA